MDAIFLCDQLLQRCFAMQSARRNRWTKASWRVFGRHSVLVADIQQAGTLDVVLAELESSMTSLSDAETPFLIDDFCLVLAKSWVSLSYEVLRTFKQRLESSSDLGSRWTEGLQSAFSSLERVRIAELKHEIAKDKKLKSRIEMFVPGDEKATTREYIHEHTVLKTPLLWRPVDGSFVWHIFNVKTGQSEDLARRDMSEHLLLELEKF
jgi:hypothetical protein